MIQPAEEKEQSLGVIRRFYGAPFDLKQTTKLDQTYLMDLEPIVYRTGLDDMPYGIIRPTRGEWRGDVFGEFLPGAQVISTQDGLRSVLDWRLV